LGSLPARSGGFRRAREASDALERLPTRPERLSTRENGFRRARQPYESASLRQNVTDAGFGSAPDALGSALGASPESAAPLECRSEGEILASEAFLARSRVLGAASEAKISPRKRRRPAPCGNLARPCPRRFVACCASRCAGS